VKGRTPTAEEGRWLDAIANLGCCVCRKYYGLFSPAETHHIHGKTKPGAHFATIRLCPPHHRLASATGEWATRHSPGRKAGRVAFEQEYGTEQELLDYTRELING